MSDLTKQELAALARIKTLDDPDKLRTLIANARTLKSRAVERAAFLKLCEVLPAARVGSLEHDVWRSIHGLEELLREQRGKTVRLSRTRQKITKDGETKTVADLTLKPQPSEGFQMLIDLDHPELVFEGVVLRHAADFGQDVRDAAAERLTAADIDLEQVARPLEET